jgi:PIN domain nuclease of toxin-antitoxin system
MARFLLDSHVFLWAKENPGKIGEEALAAIKASQNEMLVSIAGLWELAIKAANGKLPTYAAMIAGGSDGLTRSLRDSKMELLPLELSHALAAAALPQHHRDPFDRMMIAQAFAENLTLITRDRVFSRYAGLKVLEA